MKCGTIDYLGGVGAESIVLESSNLCGTPESKTPPAPIAAAGPPLRRVLYESQRDFNSNLLKLMINNMDLTCNHDLIETATKRATLVAVLGDRKPVFVDLRE